ncbi:hypothetical protein BST97_09495 [Nonlabens spongiae]|uniref:SIMPL domain-containing protein n=1 Tax=Nonlabens spongiae TaxID=331648 RepID=A0A1W6ML28_9FLAO|nr:SIMPL domain-containing protein [Nonlabens spongiae]ARN78206.1 hypothetical protein BST97_09495 [Nonlabens spongiae]
MKTYMLTLFLLIGTAVTSAQSKNFIDRPYLETQASVDTLITPDRIHLTIVLSEEDSRNRKSTEELERDMIKVLKKIGIDIEEDLTVADFDSDFRKYFLSSKKVLKTKIYRLIVKDAKTLGQVFTGLEEEDISNVSIFKTEYSKEDELLLDLKKKAVLKAQANARTMTEALGQTLGKAIFIRDNVTYPQRSWRPMDAPLMKAETISISTSQAENINFQDLRFETNVNVYFAID